VGLGCYSQYRCIKEETSIAYKPTNLTYEEAAAIPNGALTSLPFLRDKGNIQNGQKVLINGASGAVGVSAIQIAKYYGAKVTGVCSTSNLKLVESLGADTVLDYKKEDFTNTGQQWDIIFDAVGKSSFSKCKYSLSENGSFLTTAPTPIAFFHNLIKTQTGKKAGFMATALRKAEKKKRDLYLIKELVETGKLKPVIDRRYSMKEIVEAHKYVETGRKRGML